MTRSVTRRFNYTRRIEIPQSNVEIDTRLDDGVPVAVILRLSLPEPGPHAPDEWAASHLVLEAWRTDTGSYQRFDDLGMVSQVVGKFPVYSARLSEFPDEQNLTFRIKVVSASSKRILAEADRLHAAQDAGQRAELIRVIPTDLGELPWTIDWSDINEGPRILVNSNIERNRDLLTRDPVVTGLVASAVLREVLYRAATGTDTAERPDWAQRWIDFGVRLSGSELPTNDDGDEVDHWVKAILHRFASTHSLSTGIEDYFRKQEPAA